MLFVAKQITKYDACPDTPTTTVEYPRITRVWKKKPLHSTDMAHKDVPKVSCCIWLENEITLIGEQTTTSTTTCTARLAHEVGRQELKWPNVLRDTVTRLHESILWAHTQDRR